MRHRRNHSEGSFPVLHRVYGDSNDTKLPTPSFNGESVIEEKIKRNKRGQIFSKELDYSVGNYPTFCYSCKHREFVPRLFSILYAGMEPPNPLLIEALLNDPPYGFFSCLPTPSLASLPHSTCQISRCSIVRSGIGRIFSPMRKKTHQRCRRRSSMVSLPTNISLVGTSRGEHSWSMVQLTDILSPRRRRRSTFGPTEEEEAHFNYPANPNSPNSRDSNGHFKQPPVYRPQRAVPMLVDDASFGAEPDKDDAVIGQLKRDIDRLQTSIQNVEVLKLKLTDWFVKRMLVVKDDDDDDLADPQMPSVEDIVKNYTRRNGYLKRKLAELESQLSDARFNMSYREDQSSDFNTSVRSLKNHINAEELDASVSSSRTPSLTTEVVSTTQPTHKHASSSNPDLKSPTKSRVSTSIRDSIEGTVMNFQELTPPSKINATQESRLSADLMESMSTVTTCNLPLDATNSARITRIRPSGPCTNYLPSSGFSDPIISNNTSLDSTNTPLSPTRQPQRPSSERKNKSSVRGVLKQSLGNLFVRRSWITPPRHPPQRSSSDEHICGLINPSEDESLTYISSHIGNRISNPNAGENFQSLLAKWKYKKSKRPATGNPGVIEPPIYPVASSYAKKKQARSIPSSTAGHHSQLQAESITTSGGSEGSCLPSNDAVSSHFYDNAIFANVLDVLNDGVNSINISRSSAGNPPTSSGGCSTHSGGFAVPVVPSRGPLGNANFNIVSSSVPPASNVAMSLMMLMEQIQNLLELQKEAQQKVISELREELVSYKQELSETQKSVHMVTVEIAALSCDIQTKGDVQNQTLSNAIARLEQLDASAENLRQNVRQDLISLRNEHKHALDALKYQLATETRDLRDMFTTLGNKVAMMEKSELLLNLDRDQPRPLWVIANTLTDLVVSIFAFITALIQILLRFLNAGATVTNNRVWAIFLNVCLLVFLLVVFLAEPLFRLWGHTGAAYLPNSLPSPP